MTINNDVLIIGTGPSGLAAADTAKQMGMNYQILEGSSKPFGHCKSFTLPGFPDIFFDEGPHISFTKNEMVQNLFASNAPGFRTLQPQMKNYWRGHLINHPVQNNLNQIPVPERTQIIEDIQRRPSLEDKNYETWLLNAFGKTFCDLFHERYTRKYWTRPSKDLTTDWVSQRFHRPSVEDMLKSAEATTGELQHYFSHFRYPASGGFEMFLKESLTKHSSQIHFDQKVVEIDSTAKLLRTSVGQTWSYKNLVSSIPLNIIPKLIKNCPQKIQDAAEKLRVTSVTLYSFIYRATAPPAGHWLYVYDEEIPFARLYFPKALLNDFDDPIQAVQVEVYTSPEMPLSVDFNCQENVIKSLQKMGILTVTDILQKDQRFLSHSNVVFDHNREFARAQIIEYLSSLDILSVGRFGDWAYLWSDESYISGQEAIFKIANLKDSI